MTITFVLRRYTCIKIDLLWIENSRCPLFLLVVTGFTLLLLILEQVDKGSMLDDIISYVKFLQLQTTVCSLPCLIYTLNYQGVLWHFGKRRYIFRNHWTSWGIFGVFMLFQAPTYIPFMCAWVFLWICSNYFTRGHIHYQCL